MKIENKQGLKIAYQTKFGKCINGDISEVLLNKEFKKLKGKIDLIITSPPFPLNRKKAYGNFSGKKYVDWLTTITTNLNEYLSSKGSLVIEIGNAWEGKSPTMSLLPLETMIEIKKRGDFHLCQQFIWHNFAKLPSPVQWVNIDRIRVKDSFTNIWWLSKTRNPKANNRNVLNEYSDSMMKLLKEKKYNAGLRPSEHLIGEKSFLTNNGGSIPSNVLISANTASNSKYLSLCREKKQIPHPARMPESILEFFLNFLTEEGDRILDPFAGSNTTGYISEKLKRKWISIEIEKEYVKNSKLRFVK